MMNEYLLNVPGISCGHCVSAITESVGRIPGVTSVDVSVDRKTVRVVGAGSRDAVRVAVEDAGYEVAAN